MPRGTRSSAFLLSVWICREKQGILLKRPRRILHLLLQRKMLQVAVSMKAHT